MFPQSQHVTTCDVKDLSGGRNTHVFLVGTGFPGAVPHTSRTRLPWVPTSCFCLGRSRVTTGFAPRTVVHARRGSRGAKVTTSGVIPKTSKNKYQSTYIYILSGA